MWLNNGPLSIVIESLNSIPSRKIGSESQSLSLSSLPLSYSRILLLDLPTISSSLTHFLTIPKLRCPRVCHKPET